MCTKIVLTDHYTFLSAILVVVKSIFKAKILFSYYNNLKTEKVYRDCAYYSVKRVSASLIGLKKFTIFCNLLPFMFSACGLLKIGRLEFSALFFTGFFKATSFVIFF